MYESQEKRLPGLTLFEAFKKRLVYHPLSSDCFIKISVSTERRQRECSAMKELRVEPGEQDRFKLKSRVERESKAK